MSKHFFSSLTAAALLLVASATAFGQQDQVFGVKGAPLRGVIMDMKPAEITLDMAGVTRQIPVNEIVKITFAEEPTELTSARNAVAQKNYRAVLDQLEKVDVSAVEKEFPKQDIAYYRAFAQAKLAITEGQNTNEAASALSKFYKDFPNNYHHFEAAEVLGDLAVAMGRFDVAATFYGETGLAAAPWPEYKMKAGLAGGRALIMAEKFEEAAKSFDTVLASDVSTPEAITLKQQAVVGKAVCQAATGKADEGVAQLKDIIAKGDPHQEAALFARAYNALGNCYLKQGKNKEARMAFLATSLLFFSDTDAHAEALYHLAKLGDVFGPSDKAAADARNTLKERYSGSLWNRKLTGL